MDINSRWDSIKKISFWSIILFQWDFFCFHTKRVFSSEFKSFNFCPITTIIPLMMFRLRLSVFYSYFLIEGIFFFPKKNCLIFFKRQKIVREIMPPVLGPYGHYVQIFEWLCLFSTNPPWPKISQIILKTFLTYQKKSLGWCNWGKNAFWGAKTLKENLTKKNFLVKNNVISLPKLFFFILGVRTVPTNWGSKMDYKASILQKKWFQNAFSHFFPLLWRSWIEKVNSANLCIIPIRECYFIIEEVHKFMK